MESMDMLYVYDRNIRIKNIICIINELCSVKNFFFYKIKFVNLFESYCYKFGIYF